MKLEMVKGRESSLIIEDAIRSIADNGFLADSYSNAFYALCDYVSRSDRIREELFREKHPSARNGILYRSPQNIIAFSGKRGSGKSSAMLSFSDVLSKSEKLDALCSLPGGDNGERAYSNLKGKSFVVLDPIDPTTLEQNQSILSVVLSRLLFKAEENWTRHFNFYGSFQDKENKKAELLSSARQCLTGISTIKSKAEVPQELSDLQKVGDSSILKKNLFDFVELFLQFSDTEKSIISKNSILVLQIDDTDCQINQGYEVMEDIRKYLTIPNVLILMATDINQLRQVLIQHYVSVFSSNLKENFVKKEKLRHLGEKHLAKLMPPSCVIHLPNIDDIIRDKIGLFELCYYEKEGKEKNLLDPNEGTDYAGYNFQEVILRFIYKKTHIVFASHDAYANNIIPTTLRGLAYLLSLLSSMDDVPEVDLNKDSFDPSYLVEMLEAQFPILERNLDLFEDYFLHDWIQAKLPQDRIEIIEKFSNQAPDQRISFMVKELAAYYGARQSDVWKNTSASAYFPLQNYDAPTYVELDELLRTIQGTNESYKEIRFRQSEDFYFVFAVRTLLTIKNSRDVLRVKRRTVHNFKQNKRDLLIFNYLKEKTSLPTGFYLDPVKLYGYQLVGGKGIKSSDYADSKCFRTKASKEFFQTAYFHRNGGGEQHFNFTGGIIQWLAPKDEDYKGLSQLEVYKVQELAALMAANCDVQEVARKAVARKAKANPTSKRSNLKAAVESSFTWPAILRIDDDELYRMLGRGMAENHNHINGSTQSFQLTWCRIMNYPEKLRTELKHFRRSNLHSRMVRSGEDNGLGLYEQLELAALIRSILFRALHRSEFKNVRCEGSMQGEDKPSPEKKSDPKDKSGPKEEPDQKDMPNFGKESIPKGEPPFSGEQAFRDEYIRAFSFGNGLCNLIDCLRTGRGAQLDYPDGETLCIDYILDNTLIQHCVDSHIRALVGERFFLYQCTQASLEEEGLDSFEQGLFYLYLLLKCNFRSEMIQANNQTGFKNFLNYQDRKDDAWDENPYFWEAARMALNYRLDSESIVSLEGRLVPKADPEQNIKKVYRFDRAKRFADCTSTQTLDHLNYEFDMELDLVQFAHLPYFYVYHFIKLQDDRKLKYGAFQEIPCRHQKHRKNLRATAIGLATALRKSAYLRNRMRGIDASANEVGCRPEVFAPVFRYLSGVQQKWNTRLDTLLPSSPMRISKAYHAGEDFLDIADGLRAIDEAVSFLALGPGSRIGHALAMGTAPEDHYRLKNYEIITTKQDRLDDLVWILYRAKELGVQIEGQMESELQNSAYHLFRELYGNEADRRKWSCGLTDYYRSMKLRGDDPSAYDFHMELRPLIGTADEFEHYLLDDGDPVLIEYRKEDCVLGLYYRYHYGAAEGIRGQETIVCKVSKAYVELMRQIQNAMQRYLAEKRIVIECNPSSNVLIGTFKSYDRHPVFRFNSRKLGPGQPSDCPAIQVCINTDDLGIFDTSLEFEYALICQALLSQRDDSQQITHNARDVMEYLNDLREMGVMAVFPENVPS